MAKEGLHLTFAIEKSIWSTESGLVSQLLALFAHTANSIKFELKTSQIAPCTPPTDHLLFDTVRLFEDLPTSWLILYQALSCATSSEQPRWYVGGTLSTR
jgi:hypothetical protein